MKELVINKNDAGQRIDKFLTKYMPDMPRAMLYKGLRKNCVKVNGKHIKEGGFMLSEGDMLPSIRALAKDLRISVITTKRAYAEALF